MKRLQRWLGRLWKLEALKRILQWLYGCSVGQRKRILLSCLLGVCEVGCNLMFVWASKQVIDIATGAKMGSLWGMAIFAASLMAAQLAFSSLDMWLNSCLPVEGSNRLRHRLLGHLLSVHWMEMRRFHSGDLINRVSKDVDDVVEFLTLSIPALFITVLQLVASFAYFCFLDASLAWSLVFVVPLFLLVSKLYMGRMRRFNRDIRRSDSDIQSIIQESVQHHVVIKTLERKSTSIGRLDKAQGGLHRQVKERTRLSLFSRLMMSAGFNSGYLLVFLWGAARLSRGEISFGTMTAFLQLVGRVQRPAYTLTSFVPAFIKTFTAAERLMEIEALTTEKNEHQRVMLPGVELRLEGVSFAYASEEVESVLKELSMVFPAGSMTAVVGETGAGKTTLVRLILALVEPQKGRILLKDGEKEVLVSPETRANFVYVPQGNTLFSGSIRENLRMGNPEATEMEMQEALHTAVADFVLELKEGLDTVLTEQGGGLSEGQAQRVAIARALLRKGNILLLDEATSALDAQTERLLLEHLRVFAQYKTVIFITHHEALAEGCDRTYKIE